MLKPEGLTEDEWRWLLVRHPWTRQFYLHYPSLGPAGHQNVRVFERVGYDFARLVWKVCHKCQHGVISKISIAPDSQRFGVGAHLIHRALYDGPGYRWTTSSQSPEGQLFFASMSAKTGAAFTALAKTCPHIRDAHFGSGKPYLDRSMQRGRPKNMPHRA